MRGVGPPINSAQILSIAQWASALNHLMQSSRHSGKKHICESPTTFRVQMDPTKK